MKKTRTWLCVILLFPSLLCSCARTYTMKTSFRETDFEKYKIKNKGDCTIAGQVIVNKASGEVVFGQIAWLLPKNAYSEEWFNNIIITKYDTTVKNPTRPFSYYFRGIRPDEEGRFEYRDIPCGSYYVLSSVALDDPRSLAGAYNDWIYTVVNVEPGETVKVLLTRE